MGQELIAVTDKTLEESLAANGYCVAQGVFSAKDIDGLQEAVTETIDRTAHALRAPYAISHPDAPFDERLERVAHDDRAYAFALYHAVMADVQRDERFANLPAHPNLSAVINRLLTPWVVSGIVIRSRASIPSFSSGRSAWHQDVLRPSQDYTACGAVKIACWIPLSDADETSGALEVMPGRWDAPLPHNLSPDGRFSIPDLALPTRPRKIVPVRRGDVLIMDRYLPHQSLPARNRHVRWAAVMWIKASPSGWRKPSPC